MRESRQLGGQSGRFSFGRQSQSDVPIRRTIQVVVRNDRLVVLSDQSSTSAQESALLRGRQIRMNDVEAIPQNQLAEALEQHIARWGEAGTGLYWRPVMNLSIAPGAEQRGEELAELLYQNGIEVRTTRSSDIAGRSEAHGTQ